MSIDWDLPEPFLHRVSARDDDVDGFGHVNNLVYVRWLGETAWAHSDALGVTEADCVGIDRAMVIRRTEIDYERSALAGDDIVIGTWIVTNDGRLRSERRFQLVRAADGATLARAAMHFVSAALSTGAPARMPKEFADVYAVRPAVAAALRGAPESICGE